MVKQPPGAARKRLLPKLLTRLQSFLAAAYLRLVDATSQIIWVNRSIREELEQAGRGFIYTFWHGRQAFMVVTLEETRGHPLISHSRDGELIAQVCRSFGLEPVRGSSSRGGSSALREMKAYLEAGHTVGFTPDGPRGPFQEVHPGTLYLAQVTGCPIVPTSYGAKKKWIFKGRWDTYLVPKLFNRIAMVYGEPLHVGPEDDLEKKAAELKIALDDVTRKADSVAGAGTCR